MAREHPAVGVAVDRSSDQLYAVRAASHAQQFSATCIPQGEGLTEHCVPEGEFGAGDLVNPGAVGVDAKTGVVYVTDSVIGKEHIAVFGPTVIVPEAITEPASNVTGITATLDGKVDPSGSQVTECKFEWGLATAYDHTTECEETPTEIGSGNGLKVVHANIAGLGLGAKYHFRLVATSPTTVPDEKGPSVGVDGEFITLGPRVHKQSVSRVTDTSARLEGLVDPVGQPTTYLFQYVPQEQFDPEFANATDIPLGGEAIGSGNEDVAVAQPLAGLAPSTTYHYRILATNHCDPDPGEECVVEGPDQTFTA